jgi:HPt (histidine-containing phosphotransfer) domain-containing protein
MIDHSRFEQFQRHFDQELILEIIDVFIREYQTRMKTLFVNIEEKDFLNLAENSHAFKGAISNFMASGPVDLCAKLERMAQQEKSEELEKIFLELKSATEILIVELTELRKEMME